MLVKSCNEAWRPILCRMSSETGLRSSATLITFRSLPTETPLNGNMLLEVKVKPNDMLLETPFLAKTLCIKIHVVGLRKDVEIEPHTRYVPQVQIKQILCSVICLETCGNGCLMHIPLIVGLSMKMDRLTSIMVVAALTKLFGVVHGDLNDFQNLKPPIGVVDLSIAKRIKLDSGLSVMMEIV